MPKAFKSCPKSNKSSNLVTLFLTHQFFLLLLLARASQNVFLLLFIPWIGQGAVWPDLAKFRHLGKILTVFGNFLIAYLVFRKLFNLLWYIFCYWAILHCCTWPKYWTNNLAIWSHCHGGSTYTSWYFTLWFVHCGLTIFGLIGGVRTVTNLVNILCS